MAQWGKEHGIVVSLVESENEPGIVDLLEVLVKETTTKEKMSRMTLQSTTPKVAQNSFSLNLKIFVLTKIQLYF